MKYYMGIDGGGSNLRVAMVDADLNLIAQTQASTVNPNIVGFTQAKTLMQDTMRQTLAQSQLESAEIAGVGIGVAGAPANIAETWLKETIAEVCPTAFIASSSDHEIALVGANGQRTGVLVLAGTGSLAYGVASSGADCLVGGWGYLSGDEGGGYWIGNQALIAIFRAEDGRSQPTALTNLIFDYLQHDHESKIETIWDLLDWRYQVATPRTVAQLAQLVLEATEHDAIAQNIIEQAVAELHWATQSVMQRLALNNPQIAFTGGLLANSNALSQQLCEKLGLTELPQRQYEPVIGAAILAREGNKA